MTQGCCFLSGMGKENSTGRPLSSKVALAGKVFQLTTVLIGKGGKRDSFFTRSSQKESSVLRKASAFAYDTPASKHIEKINAQRQAGTKAVAGKGVKERFDLLAGKEFAYQVRLWAETQELLSNKSPPKLTILSLLKPTQMRGSFFLRHRISVRGPLVTLTTALEVKFPIFRERLNSLCHALLVRCRISHAGIWLTRFRHTVRITKEEDVSGTQ
ncbi:lysis protein [Striga asiatica]|uniref:Lysis protein n=1 Tax=Striga asiatica TaxID=4170 RepID=A0A5A7QQQ4_STRAF|nr:lysis protein [Striga asiatica]